MTDCPIIAQPRHAAEQAGGDVGQALARRIRGSCSTRVSVISSTICRRHQAFQQADRRQRQRIGQDDPQRIEVQRHHRHRRSPAGSLGSAPMSPTVRSSTPAAIEKRGQHDDGDQRRGHRGGDPRQQVDDGEADRDHGVDRPAHELQPPISSGSCAMKIRIASALTKPVITDRETKRIRSPSRSAPATSWSSPVRMVAAKQVLQPVVPHQRDHHHRGRAGRGRDHRRPPAGDGGDDGDAERGIEADFGSTPAMMEKAIASGISARATTVPASRSRVTLGDHSARSLDRDMGQPSAGGHPVRRPPDYAGAVEGGSDSPAPMAARSPGPSPLRAASCGDPAASPAAVQREMRGRA